jgi:hypothetical protein
MTSVTNYNGQQQSFFKKERGDPKTASIKPNREEKLGNLRA